jgi:hypothetical protein
VAITWINPSSTLPTNLLGMLKEPIASNWQKNMSRAQFHNSQLDSIACDHFYMFPPQCWVTRNQFLSLWQTSGWNYFLLIAFDVNNANINYCLSIYYLTSTYTSHRLYAIDCLS